MATRINTGTRDVPLKFAQKLTALVNELWERGEYLERLTPITKELMTFWFEDSYCENRNVNFHSGQRQAILNMIFVHEILQVSNVYEMYEQVDSEILLDMDLKELNKSKYKHPKYAMKMATGTGKTWVMHAALVWQFLNAKYEDSYSGRYSKNFLLVAPGLIVYERLLDAYLGKENEEGVRDFDNSDFVKFQELFIPVDYRDDVFGFIQNATCRKEEIGKKVTGEGFIAITNWHLLAGVEEEQEQVESSPLEDPSVAIKELLPITPGTTAGHSLDSLDNKFLRGTELEFLRKAKDLVVINDEAHHIHENKTYGEIKEVEWQKSLNYIAEPKGERFIQIDFSATPYDVTGSGQRRVRHFFPHIVVDFNLKSAIHSGLVKTIVLDKRKELASLPLDFKAIREGRRVIALSDGQKTMLRAGITKLRILEEHFVNLTKDSSGVSNKYPKMFVICEDTSVTPLVVDYLVGPDIGLDKEDVIRIDSDRKGNIPAKEWDEVRLKLFKIDEHPKPKVIVSVLMLREGFDVNNICVVVPLRSSQAPILLEQTVGRGLRLMWREKEYEDLRRENIELLLKKKQKPKAYIDILSIVEHPAFIEFYDRLMEEQTVAEVEEFDGDRTSVLGDLITVGLKENYQKYDIYIPIIVSDREEVLNISAIDINGLRPYSGYELEQLKRLVPKGGEVFFSEELTVKTRFGEYEIKTELFNSKSYNEFISRIVGLVSNMYVKVGKRKYRSFPTLQINQADFARAIDMFIRYRLFNQPFDPFEGNNWRVLLIAQSGIVEHIVKEISSAIYELQNSISIEEAKVFKRYFSEVPTLRMRENFALDIEKTIYEKLAYPSNKGGLEKSFMEFCDNDSEVISFVKVNEHYHTFAHINYIRADGLLGWYSPDFVVRMEDTIYIVETKAQDRLSAENVKLKQIATLDQLSKINQLPPEERMGAEWSYVLLGENTFYNLTSKGASLRDVLDYAKITRGQLEGNLFE